MKYQEFAPAETLKPYVKCFYTCEYDVDTVLQDVAFATGCIELMFNVSDGAFEVGRNAKFNKTPKAELWGQIIKPLAFRSLGKSMMIGVRFYPHTASFFLNEPVDMFNDSVADFLDIAGPDAVTLHGRLRDTPILTTQLAMLETFLTGRLHRFQKKREKFQLVSSVVEDVKREYFFGNMGDVAFKYGISTRYLQKLFSEFTGVSPKLYHKITRFQKSLLLIGKSNEPLTSVAYSCGYFDQSHFVRDFRSFTGISPSAFNAENSSAILASSSKV
jgi:AraC-like DNA-binding protein